MRLELWLDSLNLRRWHRELADSLRARGDVSIQVRLVAPLHERTAAAQRLARAERALFRQPRGRAEPLRSSDFDDLLAGSNSAVDVVIDLAGTASPNETKAWQLTFDGAAGDRSALESLLAGRLPVIAVEDAGTGKPIVGGRPGTENPGVLATAFEDLLAGCTALVHAALDGADARPPESPPIASPRHRAALGRAIGEVVSSVMHVGYRAAFRTPHWRVGWRFVDGPDVLDLAGLDGAVGWNDLPDDGLHFYADPFPIVVNDTTYLFVEDFDHRLGRGVISMVPFDGAGPIGKPRPVLDEEFHLSYPFVFEDGGEHWMIPETSAARTIQLYRAASFPDRWELESVLVDDVVASDATLIRHDDLWWILATVHTGGSYSDALHVWHSETLTGPWQTHPGNPVVVDIASARPAGRIVARDGRLLRPVQDCRGGYGSALGIAEITRLDESGYAQRPLTTIGPGERWPGRRLHTLNRAGRLECIDGSRLSPRWWPGHRGVRR